MEVCGVRVGTKSKSTQGPPDSLLETDPKGGREGLHPGCVQNCYEKEHAQYGCCWKSNSLLEETDPKGGREDFSPECIEHCYERDHKLYMCCRVYGLHG